VPKPETRSAPRLKQCNPVLEGFRKSDAVPQPGPSGGSMVAPAAALPAPGAGGGAVAPPLVAGLENVSSLIFDVDV